VSPGQAISIPYTPEHAAHVKRLLENYRGIHVGWNSLHFDYPMMMEDEGIEFHPEATLLDGMDLWHWLQSDLDKGLEHVSGYFTDITPWKHLATAEPGTYSCIDSDAAFRNTVAIIEQVKKSGSWETYKKVSIDLMLPVLYKAGRRGVHIDIQKQEELKKDLNAIQEDLLQKVQEAVDERFKKYKQYVRKPDRPGYEPITGVGRQKYCSACDKPNVTRKHPCIVQSKGTIQERTVSVEYFIQNRPGAGEIQSWVKTNGFNPNSTTQLREYIRYYGHPLGQNHKNKNADEAVDAKHLRKLAKKFGDQHPLYPLTVKIHKVSKALSTYCWTPDADGKIQTTYTNKPSTWRLASEDKNLQNVGKREDNPYAKKARGTIVPPPGYIFLQADSSSIEAVLVGHFMQDSSYIELAKKSIHAYLVCKWHGWDWNPANAAKAKKDVLYDQMKRAVHGTNYGMGYRLLYSQYEDIYPSMLEAKRCQDFLFECLPQLKEWQHQIRVRAQKECYLESPWKHRHYFYDVFSYRMDANNRLMYGPDGKPLIKLGKDGKRAVAYLPQHSGGMFARENCVLIGNSEYGQYMMANCTVHDSYCLALPEAKLQGAKQFLIDTLTRPVIQLSGLRIGCALETGTDWLNVTELETVTV
jgi:hypothetical protein